MRRLTQECVEGYFLEHGCELLSEYRNKRTKIKYQCHCGNISMITFNDFKRGRRCGCGNKSAGCRRRNSFESVRQFFSEHGCELLEDKYENGHQPMRYRCCCGRISKISYSSFKVGRRCFECGCKKNRKPYSQIKKRYRTLLRVVLESTGQRKSARTAAMLGYTVQQLWDHIHNHPNWKSLVNSRWHLDHIFPIVAFIEHGITDVKIINALDNLQPLSAIDNIKKRNKYNKLEFQEWLKKKGVDYGVSCGS